MAQSRRKKVESSHSSRDTSVPQPPRAFFGPLSATILVALGSAPIFLWGNPYPPQALPYWLWGSIAVAIVAWASTLKWGPIQKLPMFFRTALMTLSARQFAVLVFVTGTALASVVALRVFHGAGNTTDEYAQLFHARILLSGHLSLPVDPNPEFFSMDTVVDQGRWYSHFPIGGPLVIALGSLMGGPWVISALMTGISAAALYHFARTTFGEAQGRVVAIVFCLAPSIFIMGGTWMNHVPVLCLTCCMLAALAEWERANTWRAASLYAAFVGLTIGLIATIRPLDAVVLAIVVGGFQLWILWQRRRKSISLIPQFVFGFAGVLPLLAVNAKTTGHALRFAYEVQWGAGHGVGFHLDPYGQPYTVRMALERAITYVGEWNMFVTAWPVPAIALFALALFALRRPSRWDVLLITLFVAQLTAYACYWGQGELLGPRFMHNVMPVAIIFIARIPWLWQNAFGARGRQAGSALVLACLTIALCSVGSAFSPWGLVHQAQIARGTMRLGVADAVNRAALHNAVVVLREPFTARLTRRMWGLGVNRSEAAQMLKNRDACSLLAAIAHAENDVLEPIAKVASVRSAAPFVESASAVNVGDALFNSKESVDPACNAELEADARGGFIPLGTALHLMPHDATGAIDGDIIYVADLGEHNKALYSRFSNRTWYRLSSEPQSDGKLAAVLSPYQREDD